MAALGTCLLLTILPAQAQTGPDDPAAAAAAAEQARAAELQAERARTAATRRLQQAQDQVASAKARLEAARAAERTARGVGGAADGRVRAAEVEIVPPLRDLLAAEAEQERLERVLQGQEAQRRRLEDEIERTQALVEDRAVRAFKRGSLMAETALPLQVIREATTPGDLVRGLKDLEAIAGASIHDLEQLLEELTRVEADIVTTRHEIADAIAEQEEATALIEGAEATAAGLRLQALDREGQLVQAMRNTLDAETALDRAKERLAKASSALDEVLAAAADPEGAEGEQQTGADPERREEPSGDDAEDADDAEAEGEEEDGDRASQVARRDRALKRQRSLATDDRLTQRGWRCPVAGGAEPASAGEHARRHRVAGGAEPASAGEHARRRQVEGDPRFINDWGFPRSGDRKHEGTDVFVPTGTPVVAVTDGVVTKANRTESGLGGITVSFENGRDRFYNAHLQGIHPDIRKGVEVTAGQIIGWAGQTGNARGTPPHLHFGWYRDDVAANPFASLALACLED